MIIICMILLRVAWCWLAGRVLGEFGSREKPSVPNKGPDRPGPTFTF